MFKLIAVLFAVLFSVASATHGVDVSARIYTSSWDCLAKSGYTFACVRVYQGSGKPDPNGPLTINDARAGGMKYVDGYIFPCYTCGDPAGQMDATLASLAAHNIRVRSVNETLSDTETEGSPLTATVGMLWIDVEDPAHWSTSTTNNVNFIAAMINEGEKKGATIGIYTGSSQWTPITGGSTQFSKHGLWYAHYDNKDNFSDFVPFGGWTKPNIKQYAGTSTVCSASVDLNYY